MSVAIYIACEREIEGVDTYVSGKALGHVDPEVLDRIHDELSWTPLYDLMSIDPEELDIDLADLGENAIPPQSWFPADKGLATVRALRTYLQNKPSTVSNTKEVIADLDDCEKVLKILDSHDIGFHFAIDY